MTLLPHPIGLTWLAIGERDLASRRWNPSNAAASSEPTMTSNLKWPKTRSNSPWRACIDSTQKVNGWTLAVRFHETGPIRDDHRLRRPTRTFRTIFIPNNRCTHDLLAMDMLYSIHG